jgi:putative transposase
MASHVFTEIFLHINWHTGDDLPLLKRDVEAVAHNYIRNRCRQTKGVFFQGIGGTDDHIHLALQVEPFVLVSDFIGDLKGATAHEVNQQLKRKLLAWQRGYGIVSFGKRQLPWVLGYLARQREHHATGKIFARLEATGDPSRSPAEAG